MQSAYASSAACSRIPRVIRPRRRIGVDVDEVLTPFCRPMFERVGHKWPEGKFPYHYATALGISQTDSSRMVYDFYESQEFADLEPLPGALAGRGAAPRPADLPGPPLELEGGRTAGGGGRRALPRWADLRLLD